MLRRRLAENNIATSDSGCLWVSWPRLCTSGWWYKCGLVSVFFLHYPVVFFFSDPNLLTYSIRCPLFASLRPSPNTRTYLLPFDMYLCRCWLTRLLVRQCPQSAQALWKSKTFLGFLFFFVSTYVKLTLTYRNRKRMAPESNGLGSQPSVFLLFLYILLIFFL